MEDLEAVLTDGGEQPRCPTCNVLLRLAPEGNICSECGHFEPHPEGIHWPGEGDGIGSIHGG